jgi:hypothetical protein
MCGARLGSVFSELKLRFKTLRSDHNENNIAFEMQEILASGDLQAYEEFIQSLPAPKMQHSFLFVVTVWDGIGPFCEAEVRNFFWQRIFTRAKDPGLIYKRIALGYLEKGRREEAIRACQLWTEYEPCRTEAKALLVEIENGRA